MKHLIINNQIFRSEGRIPSVFEKDGQTYFGYDLLTENDHRADGWRDEIEPEYNPILQTLGEPYYNEWLDAVTREVIERTDLPPLEQAKTDKVKELKDRQRSLLFETDGYIVRRAETGKSVPQEILTARQSIRSWAENQEKTIMALTDLELVMKYVVSF